MFSCSNSFIPSLFEKKNIKNILLFCVYRHNEKKPLQKLVCFILYVHVKWKLTKKQFFSFCVFYKAFFSLLCVLVCPHKMKKKHTQNTQIEQTNRNLMSFSISFCLIHELMQYVWSNVPFLNKCYRKWNIWKVFCLHELMSCAESSYSFVKRYNNKWNTWMVFCLHELI